MFIRRLLTAGLLFFMALLALPSANGHSALVLSNPTNDKVLEAFPSEMSLTFNEELISIEGESINTLNLEVADGSNYDLLAPTVVGAVLSAKGRLCGISGRNLSPIISSGFSRWSSN